MTSRTISPDLEDALIELSFVARQYLDRRVTGTSEWQQDVLLDELEAATAAAEQAARPTTTPCTGRCESGDCDCPLADLPADTVQAQRLVDWVNAPPDPSEAPRCGVILLTGGIAGEPVACAYEEGHESHGAECSWAWMTGGAYLAFKAQWNTKDYCAHSQPACEPCRSEPQRTVIHALLSLPVDQRMKAMGMVEWDTAHDRYGNLHTTWVEPFDA